MMTVEETRKHHAEFTLQEAADRLVRQEVHLCLSSLVATLAQGIAFDTSKDLAGQAISMDGCIRAIARKMMEAS